MVWDGVVFCQFWTEKMQKTGHKVATTWTDGVGMCTIAKSIKNAIDMMACACMRSPTGPTRLSEVLTDVVGHGLNKKAVTRHRSRGGGSGGP